MRIFDSIFFYVAWWVASVEFTYVSPTGISAALGGGITVEIRSWGDCTSRPFITIKSQIFHVGRFYALRGISGASPKFNTAGSNPRYQICLTCLTQNRRIKKYIVQFFTDNFLFFMHFQQNCGQSNLMYQFLTKIYPTVLFIKYTQIKYYTKSTQSRTREIYKYSLNNKPN